MSVSGISTNAFSQFGLTPIKPDSRRQLEDNIGRQLEQALQSGNLAQAQQSYQMLAGMGPNNSGPFTEPKMQSEFQALGQDLQNGDMSAARSDNASLCNDLLSNDIQVAWQDKRNGDSQGFQAALANLRGDYWAVYGRQYNAPQGIEDGGSTTPISVQA